MSLAEISRSPARASRLAVHISLLLLVAVTPLRAQTATGFLDRSVTIGALRVPYQVYVPPMYDPARAWPVILFLHGAGERGADGLRQTEVGIGTAIRLHRAWFDSAIVVMPQCPTDSVWRGAVEDAALAALRSTIREFRGDTARVYLVGLSMGGYGAWQLASDHPGMFAALVSVCGGLTPPRSMSTLYVDVPGPDPFTAVAQRVRGTPAWIFHGAADDVVPPAQSEHLHRALLAAGSPVRFTEFPGVGHDSWDPAFGMEELWGWLLRQKKTG